MRYLSYGDCSIEGKYHQSVETDLVDTSPTFPTVIVPWKVSTTDQYKLIRVVYLSYGDCSVGGMYYLLVHAVDL